MKVPFDNKDYMCVYISPGEHIIIYRGEKIVSYKGNITDENGKRYMTWE